LEFGLAQECGGLQAIGSEFSSRLPSNNNAFQYCDRPQFAAFYLNNTLFTMLFHGFKTGLGLQGFICEDLSYALTASNINS
jgi:hypothetical protein